MGSYCTKKNYENIEIPEEKEILLRYCQSCGKLFPSGELIKRSNFGGVWCVELCMGCNDRWEEIVATQ